ncbi:MAG: aspartate kinase [Spirochaetales bacterium]|nr:aspartate kinase [Spirochaetales bacterium]
MIVSKFGGSSVSEASQIRKVKKIIESNSERRLIVVSAPGKRNSSDEKITDLLYRCNEEVENGTEAKSFKIIRERYIGICRDLEIDDISAILDEVEAGIESGKGPDYAASRGEYLSARILSVFFDAEFIDTAGVIKLSNDGRVDESSYQALNALIKGNRKYIIPGFYGSNLNGDIKTFSRGGSDITGAIAARAVGADVYENWTDVSGLLLSDPRRVDNPGVVEELTYKEIRELASIGANVFHEEAITPVKDYNIPINIRNTNKPEDNGTMIVTDRDSTKSPIVGISGKTGYRNIFVEKLMLNRYPGFREKFLAILNKNNIFPEFESTGFDSISFLAPENQFTKVDSVMNEIKEKLNPELIELRPSLALIGVVGSGLPEQIGVAADVFTTLKNKKINVRFINYGGSDITLLLGVDTDYYLDALRAIHNIFGDK